MRVEKLERWHLEAMLKRGVTVEPLLERADYVETLAINGFAGIVDEGVVACMGVCEQNPGNFRCWAFTDDKLASRYFLQICKLMRAWLRQFDARRIETVVYMGNLRGHRWVTEILGFETEGIMRKFGDGGDAMLYSRIS